jgi:NarL family two-component system sensor histidine kinase LiaS
MDSLRNTLPKLRWKLTLSYSAVTVSALLVVVLILGFLLFSSVLVPLDILNSVLTPEAWIERSRETAPSIYRYVLAKDPPDTQLIAMMMEEGDLQITYFDVLRVGDLQLRLRTVAEGSVLLVDREGVLLGISNEDLVSKEAIGLPLDRETLPGLEEPLKTALAGVMDPDRLFVTIEPDERFYFAVPYYDESEQNVIGVQIIYLDHLPTEDDLFSNVVTLLGRSTLFLLIAAGLAGMYFGFLTAKGMVSRLQQASEMADAWSQGNFSDFIEDPVRDEIGQLGQRLNRMAEQLKNLLKRRQEMAVSEERNRLARDLHDSAKQQALAASFQIGTALTLFERDAQSTKSHLQEADRLVDSVRKELTDLIHELRPQAMNGKDIAETLNDYAIEWAHQSGIEVHVDVQEPTGLSLEVKQALFRILQESLANVARHSSAECVDVVLRVDEEIQLIVKDDGQGFDMQIERGGMGLESMRERAESLDGRFIVESEPGKGTRIAVTFPGNFTNGESNG